MSSKASKRFFIVALAVIVLLIALLVVSMIPGGSSSEYLIGKNGDYVICGGERYVPAGEGFAPDSPTDRLIAENVPIEGGDLFDRYFIYGYLIYGVDDDSVIYVHTAESADSAAGYYVKESLANE